MAPIISKSSLNKISVKKLNADVGAIRINGKSLTDANLKKFITSNLGGKRSTLIEEALKKKYGLYGSQEKTKKRQSLMGLIMDDKKSGLTKEQSKRKINKVVDRSALEKELDRFDRNKTLARVGGGRHGDISRLKVGTTQAQSRISALSPNNKPLNSPAPKASASAVVTPPSIKLAG